MDEEAERDSDKSLAAPTAAQRRPSSSGQSLIYKLPFLRSNSDAKDQELPEDGIISPSSQASVTSSASAQPKTRRRRGSLRKVALLGRGAQRNGRENKQLTVDTTGQDVSTCCEVGQKGPEFPIAEHDALGLRTSDFVQAEDGTNVTSALSAGNGVAKDSDPDTQVNQDTSTTDEEDILQIPHNNVQASGSDSYFGNRTASPRSRSFQQAKSPLSYSGISSNPLPQPDADWDYSETEWWGWVVLSVTWFVFVVGMGSCLDVWSWAWDVGKTPYAPPELEDDPTLPIVGYYPALIILTCVMAWVWVVVAWVGMKYFRHAKISGD